MVVMAHFHRTSCEEVEPSEVDTLHGSQREQRAELTALARVELTEEAEKLTICFDGGDTCLVEAFAKLGISHAC